MGFSYFGFRKKQLGPFVFLWLTRKGIMVRICLPGYAHRVCIFACLWMHLSECMSILSYVCSSSIFCLVVFYGQILAFLCQICTSSSSSSSDFWLTCRYRGHIHNSGPPSRQLACCTHGRSHTRSPGVSIMRVDSWELPLSAIPLCQLLPSHLGPPRPMLSIPGPRFSPHHREWEESKFHHVAYFPATEKILLWRGKTAIQKHV